MNGTWFSDTEREALETPVIKRIKGALLRGRKQEALGLCETLRGERILLHDFFAESCTALWTWTGGELGEKRLQDMFTSVFEQSARRQMYTLLDCEMVQLVPIKLDYNGTKYNELWCDEDGKFKAKVERNDKATKLLQSQLLQGDYLVGAVLLVGARKNKETGSR